MCFPNILHVSSASTLAWHLTGKQEIALSLQLLFMYELGICISWIQKSVSFTEYTNYIYVAVLPLST